MSARCAEVLSRTPDRGAHHESTLPVGLASPFVVKVLLIRERLDGFFLERLDEGGGFVGATQHETMDDAMRQAYSEYDAVSDWKLCPDDVDPVQYLRGRFGS